MNNKLFVTIIFIIVMMVVWLMSIVLSQPANADSFGSHCVTRAQGKQLCAFWQWDSNKQVLIRNEVLRTRSKK